MIQRLATFHIRVSSSFLSQSRAYSLVQTDTSSSFLARARHPRNTGKNTTSYRPKTTQLEVLLATIGKFHRTRAKFHDKTLRDTVAKLARYYEKC